jgi:hypothetical protein
MSKSEIKGLFCWKNLNGLSRWTPCGLNFYDKLWWRFMPGVIINVAWPKGPVKVGPSHRDGWSGIGEYFEYVDSADPNDHYRPWMEQHVGRQGWDWNWGMSDNDVTENRLTIKIRQKYAKYATIAAIRWS